MKSKSCVLEVVAAAGVMVATEKETVTEIALVEEMTVEAAETTGDHLAEMMTDEDSRAITGDI